MQSVNKDVTGLATNGEQKYEGENLFFPFQLAIRQLYFVQAKMDTRDIVLKLLEQK